MTEQGKAAADVTFTITESTPSGNSYLKYCGGQGGVSWPPGSPQKTAGWLQSPPPPMPARHASELPTSGQLVPPSCVSILQSSGEGGWGQTHLWLGCRGVEAEVLACAAGGGGEKEAHWKDGAVGPLRMAKCTRPPRPPRLMAEALPTGWRLEAEPCVAAPPGCSGGASAKGSALPLAATPGLRLHMAPPQPEGGCLPHVGHRGQSHSPEHKVLHPSHLELVGGVGHRECGHVHIEELRLRLALGLRLAQGAAHVLVQVLPLVPGGRREAGLGRWPGRRSPLAEAQRGEPRTPRNTHRPRRIRGTWNETTASFCLTTKSTGASFGVESTFTDTRTPSVCGARRGQWGSAGQGHQQAGGMNSGCHPSWTLPRGAGSGPCWRAVACGARDPPPSRPPGWPPTPSSLHQVSQQGRLASRQAKMGGGRLCSGGGGEPLCMLWGRAS